MIYKLLIENFELGDKGVESRLYVNKSVPNKILYITTDLDKTNHNYFESTVHPSSLNDEQRHRVLNYSLTIFGPKEKVNATDLFLQAEFITESNIPSDYELLG